MSGEDSGDEEKREEALRKKRERVKGQRFRKKEGIEKRIFGKKRARGRTEMTTGNREKRREGLYWGGKRGRE